MKLWITRFFIFALVAAGACALALVLFIKTSGVDRLVSDYVYYDASARSYVLTEGKPKDWVAVEDVALYAKWAIIVSEDWAFYEHPGVDFNQLRLVLEESLKAGQFTRGASTITQQVIKNTLLTDDRTVWRKLQEAALALYLERIADKERILEIYLNIIELGDGIYGINQGARFYFSKAPSELNAREGAFLAMLLPSPVRYSTSFYEKELTEFAAAQVESILVKLRQADVYDEEERKRQAAKRFYWEKDFFESDQEVESEEGAPGYESFLDDYYY